MTAATVTISDDDTAASDSQPNNVVGRRGRKLDLHGGVDLAADRQRDSDTVAHGQFGRDGVFVAVDVHADQLVNSADGDGRGDRRIQMR